MKQGVTTGILLWLGIVLLLGVGWVMNLIALINCDFKSPYKAEAIRGVGVFVAPVGGSS